MKSYYESHPKYVEIMAEYLANEMYEAMSFPEFVTVWEKKNNYKREDAKEDGNSSKSKKEFSGKPVAQMLGLSIGIKNKDELFNILDEMSKGTDMIKNSLRKLEKFSIEIDVEEVFRKMT